MIFRRKKHKLPQFPPDAIPTFHRLCEQLPPESVPDLREELKSAYTRLMTLAQERPLIDTDKVTALFDRAIFLLTHYDELDPPHRGLVIGALRYFVADEEGLSDTHFASGFDDDVRVMNYVLEELGFSEECIDL